jgi:hypothetical protein
VCCAGLGSATGAVSGAITGGIAGHYGNTWNAQRIGESEARLIFRHNYPAKAINSALKAHTFPKTLFFMRFSFMSGTAFRIATLKRSDVFVSKTILSSVSLNLIFPLSFGKFLQKFIMNQIIIYQNEDGDIRIDVQMEQDTVWLSQAQMGILFDKNVRGIV